MTSRERLLTAFRGRQPDRVPVVARMWKFLRKHYAHMPVPQRILKAAEEFDLDIVDYSKAFPLPIFSPAETNWRKDINVQLREEMRGEIKYIHRTIDTPAGQLTDVKMQAPPGPVYGSSVGPEIVEPLIKDVTKDLDKIRYMMADVSLYDVQAIKNRIAEVGDRGVVWADMYSPLDCRIEDTMKQIDFLTLYYDDQGAFRELLDIGRQASLNEIKTCLEAGAEVIHVWWFYASISAGWSPRIFEECFAPMIKEQVELTHEYGAVYVYYDDGMIKKTLPFIAQSGTDAFMTLLPAPMGDIDVVEVKEEYGDRMALMGGFDAVNDIQRSTPQAIHDLVGERLPQLKKNGGYLFDASNCLPYETPHENVKAFCDAGREFGAY